jgi:hypothetical protein
VLVQLRLDKVAVPLGPAAEVQVCDVGFYDEGEGIFRLIAFERARFDQFFGGQAKGPAFASTEFTEASWTAFDFLGHLLFPFRDVLGLS